MELAFAGLHQLCAPMLDHLDRLPVPQRDALATAFGLGAVAPPPTASSSGWPCSACSPRSPRSSRWCASSTTPSGSTGRRPRPSPSSPADCSPSRWRWCSRCANRASSTSSTGCLDHTIAGLSERDARVLLESSVPGRLDDRVRDRIVAESRGNPLALLELPRALSATELAGGYRRPDAQPLANQIEQSFLRRIRTLPVETRRLLLTAAAEPVGDVRPAASGRRSARHRHRRRDRGRGRRADRRRDEGALPSPAGPIGRLSGRARPTTASWCTARWPRRPTPRRIPIDGPGIAPTPPRLPTTPWPPTSSARRTPLGPAAESPPPAPCWPGPPS